MFILIILTYAITAFLDLKATYHSQDKVKLITYFTFMTLACALAIATMYIKDIPSPAAPIRNFVFSIIKG